MVEPQRTRGAGQLRTVCDGLDGVVSADVIEDGTGKGRSVTLDKARICPTTLKSMVVQKLFVPHRGQIRDVWPPKNWSISSVRELSK